jgi:riboflavin kinase
LEGSVFSGSGEAAKFTCLPWVKSQVKKRLGFAPFAGTLNVKLTPDSVKIRRKLSSSSGIKIVPASGYRLGTLFRAIIGNIECAIILPEISNYPEDVVEILAEENLRVRLGLVDGSKVRIMLVT